MKREDLRLGENMTIQQATEEKYGVNSAMPVGVFDSGVGGISVLREMTGLLPGEDFLFYGDSDNAPYGTKEAREIQALTLEASRHMRREGIKALVIACNTATSAAITLLRETFTDIPVIGIEPALKPAVRLKSAPRVLVMATPGTVSGDKYLHLKHQYDGEADVISLACPGLMEYVERGELSSPSLDAYLEELLSPFKGQVDDIVLGCTHYPFVKSAIRKVMGEDIPILDGSLGTAKQLKRQLGAAGLLKESESGGTVRFEGGVAAKEELCRKLLFHPQL